MTFNGLALFCCVLQSSLFIQTSAVGDCVSSGRVLLLIECCCENATVHSDLCAFLMFFFTCTLDVGLLGFRILKASNTQYRTSQAFRVYGTFGLSGTGCWKCPAAPESSESATSFSLVFDLRICVHYRLLFAIIPMTPNL